MNASTPFDAYETAIALGDPRYINDPLPLVDLALENGYSAGFGGAVDVDRALGRHHVAEGARSEICAGAQECGHVEHVDRAVGAGLELLSRELPRRQQEGLETVVALVAVAAVTWMIVWMRRNGRNISGELRSRLDAANGLRAVGVVAFVAVAREGFETVLFLLGAEAGGSRGAHVVAGGAIGLADPDAKIGFGYGMNRMHADPTNGPRAGGLIKATFASV